MTDNNNERKSEQLTGNAPGSTTALNPVVGISAADFAKSFGITALLAARYPLSVVQHMAAYGGKLLGIMAGRLDYVPARKDRRFSDSAWERLIPYHYLMQSYLALTETMQEWAESNAFSELDRRKAKFILSIIGDSIAPSNYLLGNPAALKRAWETRGSSLLQGLGNFLQDLRRNGGMPSQVDKSRFKVGENLALTPGRVVFKNELLELLQYKPQTKTVNSIPLLVIPPQINKYYVYDLSPEKSFLGYCVNSGLQTFTISWRNPSEEHWKWDIQRYVKALAEAVAAIEVITGQDKINLMGACAGGITATLLASYLDSAGDGPVNSLTLSVCVLSQRQEDTDISIFLNDKRIEQARALSRRKGVLRGRELARVFAWMRSGDLIWNYVVNNYLMGRQPPAFDILYWNSDTTNLPAALHSDYLDIIAKGMLEREDGVSIDQVAIKPRESNCDKYIVAGLTDHITPWQACYRNTQILGGESQFVLSSSGHIQSLINPPGNPKARYFTNTETPASHEDWTAGAEEQQGSWWEHWIDWLQQRSGEEKPAPRRLGHRRFKLGEPAPGSYVHQQAD